MGGAERDTIDPRRPEPHAHRARGPAPGAVGRDQGGAAPGAQGGDRKRARAQAIAEALQSAAGIAAEDITLLFRGTPAENHTCGGGTPLPNRVPADGVMG